VAAVLRSFYPRYSAKKIKTLLMASGLELYPSVSLPKSDSLVRPKAASKSGKVVNLYNALLLASKK